MSILLSRFKSKVEAKCFLIFAFMLLPVCSQLAACPGLLLAYQIPELNRTELARYQLALYRFDSRSSQLWKSIPLQLDPLDSEGSLLFPVEETWDKKLVTPNDRLSFSLENFGMVFDGLTPPPCGASQIVEVKSSQGTFAYLAACSKDAIPKPVQSPVTFDEKYRTVSSSQYTYQYSKRNHLIFDKIELATHQQKMFEVAKNSDLLIVSDIKKFLTLYFDADDIDAKITKTRSGSMGFMGGLQFYLKIILFRIELALMPEVNFFDDALFMPVSMTLPVHAPKYLRRGSGVFYTWEPGKDTEWLFQDSHIEDLKLESLDPNSKESFFIPNEKYCNSSVCRYNLLGRLHGRLFSLNFAISRKASELGFFPRLIRDMSSLEQLKGKPLSHFPAERRMGVFFETSLLPRGTHTWDFWIHFPQTIHGECVHSLRTKVILPPKT